MRRRTSLSVEALEGRQLLSGLSTSLTTDQQTYKAGQSVEMTFTETNTSDQAITFGVGAVNSGFNVSEGGQIIWKSNAGIIPFVIEELTLQPGQSYTTTSTWDGALSSSLFGPSTIMTTTGSFTVTNQLDPSGASAKFQIESLASPIAILRHRLTTTLVIRLTFPTRSPTSAINRSRSEPHPRMLRLA